ncbi:MAG: TolC family protein [Campylobacterales bacterium]|nr:TolC family protein [Campylobacterales bacterium]
MRYFIICLVAFNMYALTLDEAKEIGVKNSFDIKSTQQNIEALKEDTKSLESAYLPTVDAKYNYYNKDEVVTSRLKEQSTLTLETNYNLFNGFFDKYQIESSKQQLNAKEYYLNSLKYDKSLNIATKYIAFLVARKIYELKKEALNMAEKHKNDSYSYYINEIVAKNVYLENEVDFENAKYELISAKNSLEIAKKELENEINFEITSEIDDIKFEEINFELEELKKELHDRSEIKQMMSLIDSLRAKQNVIKSDFYPKVSLSATHSRFGEEYSLNGLKNYPDSENQIGLNIKYNLYSGSSTTYKTNSNIFQTNALLEDLNKLKNELNLQLFRALKNYNSSMSKIEVAKKAIEAAEENYKIVSNQFKNQLVNSSTLIDAKYYLFSTKQQYILTVYDLLLQKERLKRVVEKNF